MTPNLPADENLIYQENLAGLQATALTNNKNAVFFFNLTVKNYDQQFRSGTPHLTYPTSIQVQAVDAAAFNALWAKLETQYSDAINLSDAITSRQVFVPPGNILAIDGSGNITQSADPNAIITPIPTVGNPVGAPVIGYGPNIFHAILGDTNPEGFRYTDATGVYVKEESIVFGPIYVRI